MDADGSRAMGKVLVVGAGQMGSGIAQVAAQAGLSVYLADTDEGALGRALAGITENLDRAREKGRISKGERDEALGRVAIGVDYAPDADIAIEAATEDFAVKRKIFEGLDRGLNRGAILATNTSSIPVTRIASATGRPGKVIGMHFSNPVPEMGLVEVIRGLETSDETQAAVVGLAKRLGKTPVIVSDSPGFVTNRLLMPMINEAVFCLAEGVAHAGGIDAVMRLGMNHPMGPLRLADLIGLDTCLAIMEILHEDLGEDKYRPCPLLRRHVDAGRLGRKSKRGFYDYR